MLSRWSRLACRRYFRNPTNTQSHRCLSAPSVQPQEVPETRNLTEDGDDSQRPLSKLLFASQPKSLSLPPESKLRVLEKQPSGLSGFALRLMGYYHRESRFLRGARVLHSRIARQVDNPALYETFNIEQNFRTTHAMLVLHVWMCLLRLRSEGNDGADFGQALYEIYNEDLEQRVVSAGVKMLFSKWMRELEKIFYGSVVAYDKAMKAEASKDELAKALWRNIFSENESPMPTGVLSIPVQSLVRYVRRETSCLALTDKESILSGNILFSTDSQAAP